MYSIGPKQEGVAAAVEGDGRLARAKGAGPGLLAARRQAFKMAHFEANFRAMTVGTSNCWTVNMKLLTRTVQTEAIENFGKEKVRKTVIFLDKTFFFVIFL